MSEQQGPWYRDGLRFRCTQCGNCCTGDPGAVWVNREEIGALSDHLELSVPLFWARYLRRLDEGISLVEDEAGVCVFFDNITRRCKVYEARPVQCRTWPFWPQNLRSRGAWEDAGQGCPGVGDGEFVPLASIRARLIEHKIARRVSGTCPPEALAPEPRD